MFLPSILIINRKYFLIELCLLKLYFLLKAILDTPLFLFIILIDSFGLILQFPQTFIHLLLPKDQIFLSQYQHIISIINFLLPKLIFITFDMRFEHSSNMVNIFNYLIWLPPFLIFITIITTNILIRM